MGIFSRDRWRINLPWQNNANADPNRINENFRRLEVWGTSVAADRVIPPGMIGWWTNNTAPDGWLLCNGASLLRKSYPDLFNAILTNFGAVDATHFTLPDIRGRVPMGAGTGAGLTARTLGQAPGAESDSVTLSVANLPPHHHETQWQQGWQVAISADQLNTNTITGNAGVTGDGSSQGLSDTPITFGIVQPSLVLVGIIKI
jgi:microcystin-dependent protein